MTRYQVELVDGDHRVSVSCDSEQEAQAALSWAQRTLNQLDQVRRSTPSELQPSNEERTSDVAFSHEVSRPRGDRNLSPEGKPSCPDHGEMAPSKFSGWYCPAKDGENWCKYKI